MTIEPIPRTLYTHPDKCAMVCLGDGSGWLVPDQPRTVGGWKIDPYDMKGRSPALFGLTDDEILRLCGAEGLAATIAEIKEERASDGVGRTVLIWHDPETAERSAQAKGGDEAEIERWRKAAERAEIDRGEWQALALNHEGAIERLTRERDAARESLSATSSALRIARAEADEAHRRADAAEPEVERLRGIVVALAARLAGL